MNIDKAIRSIGLPETEEKDRRIRALDYEISRLERKLKGAELEDAVFRALKEYRGDDEIISSDKIPEIIENQPPRIKLGIYDLDKLTGGFGEENLVIISGPTGQGKSLLAQYLTHWLAKEHRSLWFSFEMSLSELYERFSEMKETPIFYTPKSNILRSLVWLERKIVEGIAKFQTKFVFIDHTHYLVDLKELGSQNSSLYIGDLVRKLKLLARKYKIIIFLIHHLTKTEVLEAPTIADLRDSSFVGQESDYVIIVWRKPVQARKKDILLEGIRYTNEMLISVVKNRPYGRLGTASFTYHQGNLAPTYGIETQDIVADLHANLS